MEQQFLILRNDPVSILICLLYARGRRLIRIFCRCYSDLARQQFVSESERLACKDGRVRHDTVLVDKKKSMEHLSGNGDPSLHFMFP